jgi:hypothetical protein
MDVHEVATKSMQFRIGENVIQICGRGVRGMSIVEVRCLLKTCLETVEFQRTDFRFRTRSNFELRTLEKEKTADVPDSSHVVQQEIPSQCKIIEGELSFRLLVRVGRSIKNVRKR